VLEDWEDNILNWITTLVSGNELNLNSLINLICDRFGDLWYEFVFFSGKKRWPFGLFCVWSQIICHLPSSNICAHFITDIYAINVNCLVFILSLFCADLMIRYWGFAVHLWRSHDPPTTKIVTVPKLTENREPIRRHWVEAFLVLTLLALFPSYLCLFTFVLFFFIVFLFFLSS